MGWNKCVLRVKPDASATRKKELRWDYQVTSDMGSMDWLFVATTMVLWWLWAAALGRQGEIDINEFLQYVLVEWVGDAVLWEGKVERCCTKTEEELKVAEE